MLDWDDLHTFLMIARHGTLSAAARALGVRQSTMGRRLAAMTARTGATLLLRTPTGYVLTPAGEAILGSVERIEGETLAVERLVTGRDIRLEGVVRLTTVESLAVDILTPILAGFQIRYPAIQIDVLTDTRNLNLSRREADLALRIGRLTGHELAMRKVGEMAMGLYASQAYLDRHGRPDFANGAAGHRVILVMPDLMTVPEMVWFGGLSGQAMVAFRATSRFGQAAACEAGMGIACLARYLGDKRDLVRLAAPSAPPRRELWLAMHGDTRHMPRIRALTDFLTDGLKARASVLAPMDE